MNYLKVTEKNNWGNLSYHLKDDREISFGSGDEIPVQWPNGTQSKAIVLLERWPWTVSDHGHDSAYSYDEPMVVVEVNGAAVSLSLMSLDLKIGESYFINQVMDRHRRELEHFVNHLPRE